MQAGICSTFVDCIACIQATMTVTFWMVPDTAYPRRIAPIHSHMPPISKPMLARMAPEPIVLAQEFAESFEPGKVCLIFRRCTQLCTKK